MYRRFFRRTSSLILAAALTIGPAVVLSPTGHAAPLGGVEVLPAVNHDVSAPLRDLAAQATPLSVGQGQTIPLLRSPLGSAVTVQPDGAVQTTSLGPVQAPIGFNFDGVSDAAPNPCGCVPSDSNGAVGATQFVEWVNTAFAIYDKSTGARVAGPVAGNVLWTGFGGLCETHNDGDILAQYDKLAQRWVFAQFALGTTAPFFECVAVSQTSDALGAYNRYAFPYQGVPDYPKMGIWPDGYYFSYNILSAAGTISYGPKACVLDRAAMLAGSAAVQQCFPPLGQQYSTLIPSDLDGLTAPPTGEPDFYVDYGTNTLNLWKFHVDWTTPANTTFTGPTAIPVAAFTPACVNSNGSFNCVPQAGTIARLDTLGDRLMYRFAYRNFGDHESLLINHTVRVSTGRYGVRWYELRSPNSTPTVFQQATYSPDTTSRWLGSIAMDRAGDIALGYSASSTSMHPAIRYTGRVPGDPLNTLESEATIVSGTGSQTLSGSGRWGDYSSMSVDPVDDCTFWYTNQYLKTTGSDNWSTRVASFKFPGCK